MVLSATKKEKWGPLRFWGEGSLKRDSKEAHWLELPDEWAPAYHIHHAEIKQEAVELAQGHITGKLLEPG